MKFALTAPALVALALGAGAVAHASDADAYCDVAIPGQKTTHVERQSQVRLPGTTKFVQLSAGVPRWGVPLEVVIGVFDLSDKKHSEDAKVFTMSDMEPKAAFTLGGFKVDCGFE